MFFKRAILPLPSSPAEALPGRDTPVPVPDRHLVLGTPLTGPWPAGFQRATFAAALPPAFANEPPTSRSPLASSSRQWTVPSTPAPSADHVAPTRRATPLAAIVVS